MKKVFFLLIVLFAFFETNAQVPANGPVMVFTETTFDFGDIYQGDTVKHVFKFKNTGTAPLVISEVKTTCGCTAPFYSKTPVLPGESGQITIVFDSEGKSGRMTKVIQVVSNSGNSPTIFRFDVNVLPRK